MKWHPLPLQKRLNPTHVEPEKPKPFCEDDCCPPDHYVVCLCRALGFTLPLLGLHFTPSAIRCRRYHCGPVLETKTLTLWEDLPKARAWQSGELNPEDDLPSPRAGFRAVCSDVCCRAVMSDGHGWERRQRRAGQGGDPHRRRSRHCHRWGLSSVNNMGREIEGF